MNANMIKRCLQFMSWIAITLRLVHFLRATEKVCAYLIGKGAASNCENSGEIEVLQSVLPPNAVVFDVGANNGEWAIRLSAGLTAPRFFLFECAPICLKEIRTRLERIPDHKLFELAISDQNGKVEFHTPLIGSGLSSIHARRDVGIQQQSYRTILVERKTLDTIIKEQKVEKVNLLKMDIEGHELSALYGAKDSIAAGAIEIIMFEFGSADVNSRTFFRDFWDLLSEKYTLNIIAPAGRLIAIDKYSEDFEYFRGSSNYLAVLR